MVLTLFLVMFLYTGMTVMMANYRTDLRASTQAFETVQSRFASQGAVNKLFALLEDGTSPERYTVTNPLEVRIGDLEKVKAWVVKDESSGVYHLRSEYNGVSYSKVIVQKTGIGPRTYSNDDGVLYSAAASDADWAELPAPPAKAYSTKDYGMGAELNDCTELQCYPNPRANDNGQLLALYHQPANPSLQEKAGIALYLWEEKSRSWSDISPPNLYRQATSRDNAFLFPTALGREKVYGWTVEDRPEVNPLGVVSLSNKLTSTVNVYDMKTKTWSDDIEGPFEDSSILDGVIGPDDSFVVTTYHDGQKRLMQLSGGNWAELSPPNGVTLDGLQANGPDGEIFASSTDGSLYKLEGGRWSGIEVPFAAKNLLSVDASGAFIYSNDDETEFYRWEPDASSEAGKLPEVKESKGLTGGGTSEESAETGYQTTATY